MNTPRSTFSQMLSSMDTLVHINAAQRLHQCKAIGRRSEADALARQWRDTRDFLRALAPHRAEVIALLSGETLAPVSHVRAAAVQIAEEGAE